jgi:hypothetical protein
MTINSGAMSQRCIGMSVLGVVVALLFELALIATLAASMVSGNQTLISVFASCSVLFILPCCAAFRVLEGEVKEHRRNRTDVRKDSLAPILSHHRPLLQG